MIMLTKPVVVSFALPVLLAASAVLADSDNVIRQPSVAVQDDAKSAADLRKELDQTRKEAAAAQEKAQQAEKDAAQAQQNLDKTQAAVAQQQQAQAAQQPAPIAVASPYAPFVSITRMHVSTDKVEGEWITDVTTSITLNHVPNVQYTYQVLLVTGDGKPHTDVQGRIYQGSRPVSTGDDEDTDRYTARIHMAGLFTSRPPAELYIQARLIDPNGKIVAVSPLQGFIPPQ